MHPLPPIGTSEKKGLHGVNIKTGWWDVLSRGYMTKVLIAWNILKGRLPKGTSLGIHMNLRTILRTGRFTIRTCTASQSPLASPSSLCPSHQSKSKTSLRCSPLIFALPSAFCNLKETHLKGPMINPKECHPHHWIPGTGHVGGNCILGQWLVVSCFPQSPKGAIGYQTISGSGW